MGDVRRAGRGNGRRCLSRYWREDKKKQKKKKEERRRGGASMPHAADRMAPARGRASLFRANAGSLSHPLCCPGRSVMNGVVWRGVLKVHLSIENVGGLPRRRRSWRRCRRRDIHVAQGGRCSILRSAMTHRRGRGRPQVMIPLTHLSSSVASSHSAALDSGLYAIARTGRRATAGPPQRAARAAAKAQNRSIWEYVPSLADILTLKSQIY